VRCALLQGLADPDTTGMRQQQGGGGNSGLENEDEEDEIEGSSIFHGTQDVADFDFEDDFSTKATTATAAAAAAVAAAPQPPKREIGIRRFLFDFWSEHAAYLGNGSGDKGGNSSTLQSRLKQLLGDLWDASVAPQWVHYSAFLLLDQVCCSSYSSFSMLQRKISPYRLVFRGWNLLQHKFLDAVRTACVCLTSVYSRLPWLQCAYTYVILH